MSLHELTAEQQEIRSLARRFADERIAPHAAAWDRDHTFPREVFVELGELGLMGTCVPVEQGGAGADFLAYVLVLEELSRADAGVGVTVAVHTSACTLPLLAHGSPYVQALAAGEEIGAFALTEAGSGSDASAMRTRYAAGAITGNKQWITNGSHAASPTRRSPRTPPPGTATTTSRASCSPSSASSGSWGPASPSSRAARARTSWPTCWCSRSSRGATPGWA